MTLGMDVTKRVYQVPRMRGHATRDHQKLYEYYSFSINRPFKQKVRGRKP